MARLKVLAVGLLTSALVSTGGAVAHADPIEADGTGANKFVEMVKCVAQEAYPWKDVPPGLCD
jgi:hypothetical protein